MKEFTKETTDILWQICMKCPRFEECPMFYVCKQIKEIGEHIEDIYYDDTDLGVE